MMVETFTTTPNLQNKISKYSLKNTFRLGKIMPGSHVDILEFSLELYDYFSLNSPASDASVTRTGPQQGVGYHQCCKCDCREPPRAFPCSPLISVPVNVLEPFQKSLSRCDIHFVKLWVLPMAVMENQQRFAIICVRATRFWQKT